MNSGLPLSHFDMRPHLKTMAVRLLDDVPEPDCTEKQQNGNVCHNEHKDKNGRKINRREGAYKHEKVKVRCMNPGCTTTKDTRSWEMKNGHVYRRVICKECLETGRVNNKTGQHINW